MKKFVFLLLVSIIIETFSITACEDVKDEENTPSPSIFSSIKNITSHTLTSLYGYALRGCDTFIQWVGSQTKDIPPHYFAKTFLDIDYARDSLFWQGYFSQEISDLKEICCPGSQEQVELRELQVLVYSGLLSPYTYEEGLKELEEKWEDSSFIQQTREEVQSTLKDDCEYTIKCLRKDLLNFLDDIQSDTNKDSEFFLNDFKKMLDYYRSIINTFAYSDNIKSLWLGMQKNEERLVLVKEYKEFKGILIEVIKKIEEEEYLRMKLEIEYRQVDLKKRLLQENVHSTKINWGNKKKQQQKLDKEISLIRQKSGLDIRGYPDLGPQQLLPFLERLRPHAQYLKYLNLADIEGVGQTSFNKLASCCQCVEFLDISGWVGEEVRWGFLDYSTSGKEIFKELSISKEEGQQKFPNLICLNINRCRFLEKISIHLPKLNILEIKKNGKLKDLSVYSHFLSNLDLRETPGIDEKKLKEIYWKNVIIKEGIVSKSDITVILDFGKLIFDYAKKLELKENSLYYLSGLGLGTRGIQKIAERYFPFHSNPVQLDLGYNFIGTEGTKVLASLQILANLTNLNLGGSDMGAEGVKVLASSHTFKNLIQLDLKWNHIGDEGVKVLASSRYLTRLKNLNLESNNISDEGVKALIFSNIFIRLIKLTLGHNNIGNEGAEALYLRSYNLPDLTELDLIDNNIGDLGATALLSSVYTHPLLTLLDDISNTTYNYNFKKLTSLNLMFNKISEKRKESIRNASGCSAQIYF